MAVPGTNPCHTPHSELGMILLYARKLHMKPTTTISVSSDHDLYRPLDGADTSLAKYSAWASRRLPCHHRYANQARRDCNSASKGPRVAADSEAVERV